MAAFSPHLPALRSQLDDLRSSYADIDGLLVQLSDDDRSILRDVFPPSVLPQYQLLFLPQIGFLCRLPLMSDTSPSPSRVEFDFKFKTDAHIFYKNATARTLDEQFGDMQGNITDIENAIIREVQAKINESADVVRQLSGKIAELDWSDGRHARTNTAHWDSILSHSFSASLASFRQPPRTRHGRSDAPSGSSVHDS